MSAVELTTVPLAKLHESPLNPRHNFDAVKLAELTQSIREKGLLTPLLVRPNAKGFEIAAGHRRARAAAAAGLEVVPAIVRAMTDGEFLELLSFENLERDDLHPLEEADAYRLLMERAGYTVDRIAARLGKSAKYVYDRVKLLQLTPAAKKAFLAGSMTAGHAILLARLTAKDQGRAMEMGDRGAGGLYEVDGGLFEEDAERTKPRSVREFQRWIDEHVRFDKTAVDPMLFPETAGVLGQARETAEKVVQITEEHYVQPEARDAKERIFGPRSWKRADGHQKSKPCEHAITGVIVAGEGRGHAFKVCTAKEKCKTHWGAEQKQSAARRRQLGRPASVGKAADPAKAAAREEKQRAQEALEHQLGEETDKRFVTQLLDKLGAAIPREAWLFFIEEARQQTREMGDGLLEGHFTPAQIKHPDNLKTAQLPRLLVALYVAGRLADEWEPGLAPVLKLAKALKVDRLAIAKAIQAEHVAREKAAAAVQTSAKKPAKRKKVA